jgi:hypothetical protein
MQLRAGAVTCAPALNGGCTVGRCVLTMHRRHFFCALAALTTTVHAVRNPHNQWLREAFFASENARAAGGKSVNPQGNTSAFTVP